MSNEKKLIIDFDQAKSIKQAQKNVDELQQFKNMSSEEQTETTLEIMSKNIIILGNTVSDMVDIINMQREIITDTRRMTFGSVEDIGKIEDDLATQEIYVGEYNISDDDNLKGGD